MILNQTRLSCKIESGNGDMFFSLMENLNNLFVSNNPDDIIEFYSKFEDREALVTWMMERPNGRYDIHEIEGDKDVIVVMTTADYNGDYAKRCREDIYKGLHMVFVESGGRGDYYINCGRNMNIGVRKAMSYNPKWIILSGDDMYKIDDISVLKSEVAKYDPNKIDTLYLNPPGIYHSAPGYIGRPGLLYELAILTKDKYKRTNWAIRKRFQANKYVCGRKSESNKYLYGGKQDLILTNDFVVLSSKFLESEGGVPYDDPYICGADDDDLALRLRKRNRFDFINYQIGSIISGTLGVTISRSLRHAASQIYFNYKIDKGLLPL